MQRPHVLEQFTGVLVALLGALRQVVDMMEATDLDASPILATGDVQKPVPEL